MSYSESDEGHMDKIYRVQLAKGTKLTQFGAQSTQLNSVLSAVKRILSGGTSIDMQR